MGKIASLVQGTLGAAVDSRSATVGPKVVELWERVAAVGIQEAAMRAAPYAGGFVRWFVAQLGGVGVLLVEFFANRDSRRCHVRQW